MEWMLFWVDNSNLPIVLGGAAIAILFLFTFIVWRTKTNANGTTNKWHKWQCALFIPAAIGYAIMLVGMFHFLFNA